MDIEKRFELLIPLLIKIWRKKNGFTNPKLPLNKLTENELDRITKHLKHLSKGLTDERIFIGARYLDNPDLLGSYMLYFWIKSYIQTQYAFNQLSLSNTKSALDLGSGPGPVSAALNDCGINEITICDNSKKALKLAAEIFTSLGIGQNIKIKSLDLTDNNLSSINDIFDCAVLSHVLNELWNNDENKIILRQNLIENIFTKINPNGFIVIIEPALLKVTKDLLLIRDNLFDKGYKIIYPCFFNGKCPSLLIDNATCHQEIKWNPPKLISNIAAKAGFHINPLPAGILIIGNKEYKFENKNNSYYRVVSERMLSKNGKYRFFICGDEGRFSLSMKKKENYQSSEIFLRMIKGDVITFDNCTKLENGYILNHESKLQLITSNKMQKF